MMNQSPPHRRFRRRAAKIAAAVAVVIIVALGCDEKKHYRTLSFFFDGVPDPNAPEPERVVLNEAGEPLAVVDEEEDGPTVWYYHTPYENRNCFGCHDRETGFEVSMDDKNLCGSCHETYVEVQPDDWVHGPVRIEGCGLCHEPHRAEYPGVLKAPQPDICFQCHDPNLFDRSPYHAALEDRTCSRCHDPHNAGNRLLLVDSRTFARRRRTMPALESPHDQWQRDTCAQCHMEDQSNVLRDDVATVCISCHESVLDISQGPLHEAVTDQQCLACHTAHKSKRDHLIRPNAERNCYNCHEPSEMRDTAHPNMVRADCLICHAGHHSERDNLVKPLVSLPTRSSEQSPWDELRGNQP